MAQGNNGNLAYVDAEHVSHIDAADLKTVPAEVITSPKHTVDAPT